MYLRKLYCKIFNKKVISCMGIVVFKDQENEKVLILNNEREWVFPKGHVEKGETFLECVIREVKEESNIILKPIESIGQIYEYEFYFDLEKAIKQIKVFGFIIKEPQEVIYNKDECFIDGKFVTFDEAFSMLKHNDAKKALEKMIMKLNFLS